MSDKNIKTWYQSKTIWAAIITGLIGIYNGVAPTQGWPAIPDWVFALLAALGVYSRATATTTVKRGLK